MPRTSITVSKPTTGAPSVATVAGVGSTVGIGSSNATASSRRVPTGAASSVSAGAISAFGPAPINTRYIRQGASGANNGTDWTNAYTSLSSATSRGFVYYVADTSSNFSAPTFGTAASGTQTITLKKATVAEHGTDVGWSDTYGDGVASFRGPVTFNTAYYVFDGATGGGPDNWTSGHGFAVDHTGTAGAGIAFNANHIDIKHTKLTGNNGTSDSNSDTFAWQENSASDISVSYCMTVNSGRCVIFHGGSFGQRVLFEYNHFGNITGFGSVHGETGSIWSGPLDWTFRYNVVIDIDSTGGLMWDNSLATSGSFWVYGNVFYDVGSAWGFHGNGVLGGWTGANAEECRNFKAYNNTFITVDSETACLGSNPSVNSGMSARNNLFYLCANVDAGIWSPAYNHFISSEAVGSNQSSSSGDPFVDYVNLNFRLKANTTAGFDLGAPFNKDMFGNTRTTWTRGAVEYGS